MEGVALITGGSSGIGRETALAFARAGVKTAIADIQRDAGEALARELVEEGFEALFVAMDVTSATQVEHAVEAVVKTWGRLDYAFNNAGVATRNGGPIADFPEEEWDRILAINLKGVWLCMKYQCRQMSKQRRGSIVNTSSIMGLVSKTGLSAYSAAKAGVIGLTRSVAMDYANIGIRVNAICPGGIVTPMTTNAEIRESMGRVVAATPVGRMGEAREIAESVLWLCSDKSSYITGQAIAIDGGYTTL
jgi:NAD(P)-dependent dehydrogenase (short-subunit alcohol dehydrogenase family)